MASGSTPEVSPGKIRVGSGLLPDVRTSGAEQAGAMTQNTEFPAYVPPPPAPRPPLRRSQSDRVLGGVAAGFARWLGIDPVIVRVVLVVLAVFGGSGLLLYLIGWLFIPEEGAPSSQAERFIDQSRAAELHRPHRADRDRHRRRRHPVREPRRRPVRRLGRQRLRRAPARRRRARPVPGEPAARGAGPDGPRAAGDDDRRSVVRPAGHGRRRHGGAPDAGSDRRLPPAAYAYGGSGAYPGYVAPQPTPVPPTPRPQSYLGLATAQHRGHRDGDPRDPRRDRCRGRPRGRDPGDRARRSSASASWSAPSSGRARWLVALAIPLLLVTAPIAMIPSDFGQRLDAGHRRAVRGRRRPSRRWPAPYELSVGSADLDLTGLVIPRRHHVGRRSTRPSASASSS